MMDPWIKRRLKELRAAAPVKRKKADPFVKVPLWWAIEAAKATKTKKKRHVLTDEHPVPFFLLSLSFYSYRAVDICRPYEVAVIDLCSATVIRLPLDAPATSPRPGRGHRRASVSKSSVGLALTASTE